MKVIFLEGNTETYYKTWLWKLKEEIASDMLNHNAEKCIEESNGVQRPCGTAEAVRTVAIYERLETTDMWVGAKNNCRKRLSLCFAFRPSFNFAPRSRHSKQNGWISWSHNSTMRKALIPRMTGAIRIGLRDWSELLKKKQQEFLHVVSQAGEGCFVHSKQAERFWAWAMVLFDSLTVEWYASRIPAHFYPRAVLMEEKLPASRRGWQNALSLECWLCDWIDMKQVSTYPKSGTYYSLFSTSCILFWVFQTEESYCWSKHRTG